MNLERIDTVMMENGETNEDMYKHGRFHMWIGSALMFLEHFQALELVLMSLVQIVSIPLLKMIRPRDIVLFSATNQNKTANCQLMVLIELWDV